MASDFDVYDFSFFDFDSESPTDAVDEIAAYLGTITPTLGTIVKRKSPATPNAVMVVLRYGGLPPEHQFGSPGFKRENIGIQIRARGEEGVSLEPEQRILRAFEAIGKIQAMTLSGTKHFIALPQQSPYLLEEDANKRSIYVFNFILYKELVGLSGDN